MIVLWAIEIAGNQRWKALTRVHIVGTGGTIASRPQTASAGGTSVDAGAGAVASVSIADIVHSAVINAELEISAHDILMAGSYNLSMSEILHIAREVMDQLNDPQIDGVVVTHGTDTLEESVFLAELVNGSEKTVVFTGAQRSADHADTDGPRNLAQALAVAADPRFSGMGALVCFDGVVQSARGVRKVHTTASQPFSGGTVVGVFRGDDLDLIAYPARRDVLPIPGHEFGSTRIDIAFAYPGSPPDGLLRAAEDGAKGIILAGTGVGNAGPGYVAAIAELMAKGIPVVLGTRAPSGPVVPLYGNGGGVDLFAAGAVSAGSLSPFQARILAACLLSREISVTDFASSFGKYR